MALQQPIALDTAAGTDRPGALALRNLLKDLTRREGVVGVDDFKVTALATPSMAVNVAAGSAFVDSDEDGTSSRYWVRNDGTVQLTVSAADATNPRKDVVFLRIRDAKYSGTVNAAELVVLAGTPAGTPTEPDPTAAGYKNWIKLAVIDVAANASSIANANITDARIGTGLNHIMSRVPMASMSRTTSWSHGTSGSWLTVPFETEEDPDNIATPSTGVIAPPPGLYLVSVGVTWDSNGTGERAIRVKRSDGTLFGRAGGQNAASYWTSLAFTRFIRIASGQSLTLEAYQTSGGALNIAGSGEPAPFFDVTWIRP